MTERTLVEIRCAYRSRPPGARRSSGCRKRRTRAKAYRSDDAAQALRTQAACWDGWVNLSWCVPARASDACQWPEIKTVDLCGDHRPKGWEPGKYRLRTPELFDGQQPHSDLFVGPGGG